MRQLLNATVVKLNEEEEDNDAASKIKYSICRRVHRPVFSAIISAQTVIVGIYVGVFGVVFAQTVAYKAVALAFNH